MALLVNDNVMQCAVLWPVLCALACALCFDA